MLTLFHPATGRVGLNGVTHCPNAVLHPWLKQQLAEILLELPPVAELDSATIRQQWQRWQEGLTIRFTLPTPALPGRPYGCCWSWTIWPAIRHLISFFG